MRLINSGKLGKGSAICYEEAGVGISSKTWMSQSNRLINFLIQTFRADNFVMILNAPYMDFVDASMRKLIHAEMITDGINLNKQTVRIKPQCIQYNSRIKKFYFKYLRVMTGKGYSVKVERWNVPKPSKKLLNAYTKRKFEYLDRLKREIEADLLGKKKKKHTQVLKEDDIVMIESRNQGMTFTQIAYKLKRHLGSLKSRYYSLETMGLTKESTENLRKKYNIPRERPQNEHLDRIEVALK